MLKASVGLNALEHITHSLFNDIICGTTPEIFPAPIRGSAAGLCPAWGHLVGTVALFAARGLIDGSSNGVLWLAVGGIFLSAVMLVFLPIDTAKRKFYWIGTFDRQIVAGLRLELAAESACESFLGAAPRSR